MPVWLVPLLGFLQPVLDRVLPDKAKQAELQAQLSAAALAQEGAQLDATLKVALAQAEVNKAEAAGNAYQSGWRPTIGYVCAAALAYYYVIHPLLGWGLALSHSSVAPPEMILDDHLWELMAGMLGLGGFRSYEKVKGVTK
jgi:hypothetical protein